MSATQPPARPPRWTERRDAPVLGVVMIVRNEAHNLPHLFPAIADLADEVVVVDTGSDDATVAVCEAWGVRVVRDPWRDDFAHSRNRSLDEATARYAMWLDGDDRLPPATRERLIRLRDTELRDGPERAFLLEVNSLDENGEPFDVCVQARIFPRRPGIRFRGAVHEEVASSLAAHGVESVRMDALIQHVGYGDAATRHGKARRNEALLRAELERDPSSAHARIHLAQSLAAAGDAPGAVREMTEVVRGLADRGPTARVVAEVHALRAVYRLMAAQPVEAGEDLESAARQWPEWALPHALLADLHRERGDAERSRGAVRRARRAGFAPTSLPFPTVEVRRDLELCDGRLRAAAGDRVGAIEALRAALALLPSAVEVRIELGQLLLEAERFSEARATLEPAGSDPAALPRFVEVASALALARLATGDEPGAVACLVPLLDRFAERLAGADDVGPLELAEAALLEGHGDAARNLMTLYQHSLAAAA